MDSAKQSESKLIDINKSEISYAFQEIVNELNHKVIMFTNKYWRYVYLDRFFKITISMTSMVAVMLLSFDVIPIGSIKNHATSDMISIYIVYSLMMINLICMSIISLLQVRVKCVYYSTILNLYKNKLSYIKKKILNPIQPAKIQQLYEKILLQLNAIENYEDSYQMR